jgi:hypothetical protein
VLLISSDWSAFQTNSIFKDISEPSAGLDVIFPVVIYPILFIFSKKIQLDQLERKKINRFSLINGTV